MTTRADIRNWATQKGFAERPDETWEQQTGITTHRLTIGPRIFRREFRHKGDRRWTLRYRGDYSKVTIHSDGTLEGIELA